MKQGMKKQNGTATQARQIEVDQTFDAIVVGAGFAGMGTGHCENAEQGGGGSSFYSFYIKSHVRTFWGLSLLN